MSVLLLSSSHLRPALCATLLVLGLASPAASQITINGAVPLTDYSAGSDRAPATIAPGFEREDSTTSRTSINGRPTTEAPVITPDTGLYGSPYDPYDAEQPEELESWEDDQAQYEGTLIPEIFVPELSGESYTGELPQILRDTSQLPDAVKRMHMLLHDAALSGDINNLRLPIEMNEMPPILGRTNGAADPIAQLHAMSGDANGAELLAMMAEVLESDFIHVGEGTPQEMYVWPYLAQYPFAALTPPQQVDLFRLVTAPDLAEMLKVGRYTAFRLGIGPDGTWHYFVYGE